MLVRTITVALMLSIAACRDSPGERRAGIRGSDRPDERPVMVNRDLPFRYPPPLYARKVQGNVMLRLFIDNDGRVFADSTRVEESSGYGALDSAAVKGSQELHFIPAKLHGEPIGVSVLFPVYFRHPEAPPVPGDSVLARREDSASATPPSPPRP